MSSTPPAPFRLLISLNGSLAEPNRSISGGDVVLFKFVRLCGLQPDLLLPKTAQAYVEGTGTRYLTQGNLRPTLIGILLLFSIRILQGVWKAIRNKKVYDIALACSPFGVDLIPIWFWKARRKGAIIFHLLPPRKAMNFATRIRFAIAALEQYVMLKVLRRACDFVVAGNAYTRDQVQQLLPGRPVLVLPAGFDASVIDRAPRREKDPNLACFVGRLVSQKGIFDLVTVMEAMAKKNPALRLAIAGSGPEKGLLEQRIRERQISNIDLVGFVSEEQKIDLLQRSTYFFFPSYEEGWGIALAEALYCECRCVCYELPHYRSIFGDFPIYARLADPQDFIRAVPHEGRVSPEQKSFVRQYDDSIIVQTLVQHLSERLKDEG